VRRHPAPDARRRRGYRFRHADPSRELRYREEALAAVDTAKERMRGGPGEVVLFIRFVHGRKCLTLADSATRAAVFAASTERSRLACLRTQLCCFDLDQFGIRRSMHPRLGANWAGMFDLRARPRPRRPTQRKRKISPSTGQSNFACGLWPTITA
jgi:hypothetical protein